MKHNCIPFELSLFFHFFVKPAYSEDVFNQNIKVHDSILELEKFTDDTNPL